MVQRDRAEQKEEDMPRVEKALRSKRQKTNSDGDGKKRKGYRISLTVLDRETGERRACTVSEAGMWDWITGRRSAHRPVAIATASRGSSRPSPKAEDGCEEVELVEAPFIGCSATIGTRRKG